MPESEDFLQICHSYKHLCDDFPAGSRRHITFLGGRVALNLAISNCLGTQVPHPIGRDIYGAPILPPGVAGSISHKNSFAVGIAAPSSEGCVRMLGVDIEEYSRERHQGIATRILTSREIGTLGKINNVSVNEEIMLRFSLKESVFKAIHPLVKRHVSFKEVEVYPQADGYATIQPLFDCSEDTGGSVLADEGNGGGGTCYECSGWKKWHVNAYWRKINPWGDVSDSIRMMEENGVRKDQLVLPPFWLTIVDIKERSHGPR